MSIEVALHFCNGTIKRDACTSVSVFEKATIL